MPDYIETATDKEILYSGAIFRDRDKETNAISICLGFELEDEDEECSGHLRLHFKKDDKNSASAIFNEERHDFTWPELGCRNYKDQAIFVSYSVPDSSEFVYRKGLIPATLKTFDPLFGDKYRKRQKPINSLINDLTFLNEVFESHEIKPDFDALELVESEVYQGRALSKNFMVTKHRKDKHPVIYRLYKPIGFCNKGLITLTNRTSNFKEELVELGYNVEVV